MIVFFLGGGATLDFVSQFDQMTYKEYVEIRDFPRLIGLFLIQPSQNGE